MVPQVWGRLRPQAPQATAEARRHLDLDEVFLRINGELHYLWRAVDQPGVVLDILVQERRNATAACARAQAFRIWRQETCVQIAA
jgi:transposase-like protein